MGDLTLNFSERQFRRRGEPLWERDRIERLARNLEVLAEQFDDEIEIVSGCRDLDHNDLHEKCEAVDVFVPGLDPAIVHATIAALIESERMEDGGLALFEEYVHYDLRGRRARGFGDAEDGALSPDDIDLVGELAVNDLLPQCNVIQLRSVSSDEDYEGVEVDEEFDEAEDDQDEAEDDQDEAEGDQDEAEEVDAVPATQSSVARVVSSPVFRKVAIGVVIGALGMAAIYMIRRGLRG